MKNHEYIQIGDKIRIACINYSVTKLYSLVYTTKINHHLVHAGDPNIIITMHLKIEEPNLTQFDRDTLLCSANYGYDNLLEDCIITNRPADYFHDVKEHQVTTYQNFNFCQCEHPHLIWNEALGKVFQVCKVCGREKL